MSKLIRKVVAPALAAALVLMLCCVGALMPQGAPNKAYAVINLGALSMSMSAQAQVNVGNTVNVSCVVTPGSSSQMPNCEMDYCPSGCDAAPIAGGRNGCQDASGQCTCNGGGYTTYYPQVSVYSDNPGVARGTWSGNTLTISGYAPGTAHISATGSMRLFTPASQTITVTVAENGSSNAGDTGSGGSAGGTYVAPKPSASTPAGGGTNAPVVSPSENASVPVVVSVGDSSEATSSEQAAAATQVVQLVTEAAGAASADEVAAEGGQTIVAALGDAATSVRELLSQIVDTVNQVMFWAGSNEEVPDYVWSAQGAKMTSAPERDIDLTVRDVTASESELADALSGRTYMALDTNACGRLPGQMTLTYRVADVFATGSYVNVYTYDAEADTFARVQRNVAVTDGYVSIPVSEGALLVISDDDDLANVKVGAAAVTAADAADDADGDNGVGSGGGVPAGVIAAVVVVVVVAGVVGGAMYARRRQGAAGDAAASAESGTDKDVGAESITTADAEAAE